MKDVLVRLFGWRATMLHGDPCVFDRWMFVRRYLRRGAFDTLDAGAGNGGFALYAASEGNRVVGLSFAEQEMTAASRRASLAGLAAARFRIGDLRQIGSFKEELGDFDQILCLEVIEHLVEDQRVLRELAGLLRPGGQLLLSTPSAAHRGLRGERISTTEDGGHVRWGYEPERVAEIMRAAGLEVVAQGAVSGLVSQQLTNLMRSGQSLHAVAGWAIVLPLRPLQILDRWLTVLTRYPYLCVTAVGVKRA